MTKEEKEIYDKVQKEFAAKGGQAMFDKYGKKKMSEMGKKGSKIRWDKVRAEKKKVETYIKKHEQHELYNPDGSSTKRGYWS